MDILQREIIKSKLNEYYSYDKEIEDIKNYISQILDYNMAGLKGISYDKIMGGNTDRQHMLILGEEKKDSYVSNMEKLIYKKMLLHSELHLERLTDQDKKIVELAHKNKLPYENIASEIGYANKMVICRKLTRIYHKLLDN